MKTLIFLILALMVVTFPINAQKKSSAGNTRNVAFTPKTGDTDIDRQLKEINKYGMEDFISFKRELAKKFGLSKREITKIYPKDKIEPGDTFIEPGEIFKPGQDLNDLFAPGDSFYAYSLSSVTGKPANVIIELFSGKKDWAGVTGELGINPGSNEFNEIKKMALSGIGRVKGRTRL